MVICAVSAVMTRHFVTVVGREHNRDRDHLLNGPGTYARFFSTGALSQGSKFEISSLITIQTRDWPYIVRRTIFFFALSKELHLKEQFGGGQFFPD